MYLRHLNGGHVTWAEVDMACVDAECEVLKKRLANLSNQGWRARFKGDVTRDYLLSIYAMSVRDQLDDAVDMAICIRGG